MCSMSTLHDSGALEGCDSDFVFSPEGLILVRNASMCDQKRLYPSSVYLCATVGCVASGEVARCGEIFERFTK